MSIAAVEEKFRELPEAYVVLVNDYVYSLLERAKKCRTCRVSYLFLGIDTIKPQFRVLNEFTKKA